jgi:hypothetical protein
MVATNPTFPEPRRSSIRRPPPMSEHEWLHCDNSETMLEFVRLKATKRKLRLFAAACFRRLARLLPDSRQQQAIELLANPSEELGSQSGVVRRVRQALPPSEDSFGGKCTDTDDPYFVGLMLYRELVSPSTALSAANLFAWFLTTLPEIHASLPLLPRAYELSSQSRIGVFDCLYVALAEREQCEVVTADARLAQLFPAQAILLSALA